MSTITDTRNAIVTAFDAALTGSRIDVGEHGGRFGAADLARYSTRAPSVRVACLGVRSAQSLGGAVTLEVSFAAFIITRNTPGLDRADQAQALAETILRLVPLNDWGTDAAAPGNIRADNLYAGEVDKKGVALWAVSWQQSLTIERTDTSALDVFALLHADTDFAAADGTIDMSQDITVP